MSMRCMDVLLAFPVLLLAIAIVTVWAGPDERLIAISLVSIPLCADRRASVLSIREHDS